MGIFLVFKFLTLLNFEWMFIKLLKCCVKIVRERFYETPKNRTNCGVIAHGLSTKMCSFLKNVEISGSKSGENNLIFVPCVSPTGTF